MEYRTLGRTGVSVSPLCLGAMNFGGPTPKSEAIAIIDRALEGGINFLDTADVYNGGESERIVGEALKANGRRNDIVLATKVYNATGPGPNDRGLSRYHIIRACEDSLRRLQTDRIDLYQMHRPPMGLAHEETLRACEDLVRAGKITYVGSSTYAAWMVMEGLAIGEKYGWVRYSSEQPPYNLLDRRAENELIPLCRKYGLAVLPWSPLAGGILAGRYPVGHEIPEDTRGARTGNWFRERITQRGREVAARLVEPAQARGLTLAQFALLWVLNQPGVTAPIIGPRTLVHLESFLPVAEMTLTDADRALFDSLVHPGNAVSDFHNSNDWMKARIND